ncbi:alpha-(1,3)-fucosyltransferase C-like isoform X1 [Lutzomyia longipalpis]|uniref:alpha-(1,3)-fucosyltransferase C-like isoform X1 n=2 Tax=Lutzomyia longipalpis TaxID=7200 RepID=UPI002483EAE1|nr:alpha-(1,3)-fucosyltransferase C-like isoform X1 [Lutzomyia longipalpis]
MHSYAKIFFVLCIIFTLIFFPWEVIFVSEDELEDSSVTRSDFQKSEETNNQSQEEGHQLSGYKVKHILLYQVPPWMKTVLLAPTDNKCIVTSDKNYLPQIENFDALLFSGQHRWTVEENFPKVRSPHQLYVFVDLECPLMSFHEFSVDPQKEIYNLTMTYRRDSDIYWPYGFITDRKIKYQSQAEEPNWMNPVFEDKVDPTLLERITSKNRTAAWFVSNCYAHSQRTYLAQALQKVIDVDIYGKCGPLKCPRNMSEDCYEHVDQEYFFYLSFENSLCKDYLTEKVFNIMRYSVVPVVYGGANYSQHLPPHSYINANDFDTATELANYLTYLRSNITAYVQYFWWKKYYKTIVSGKIYNNLCDKLHDLPDNHTGKFYDNIKTWWEKDQCTNSRRIHFV